MIRDFLVTLVLNVNTEQALLLVNARNANICTRYVESLDATKIDAISTPFLVLETNVLQVHCISKKKVKLKAVVYNCTWSAQKVQQNSVVCAYNVHVFSFCL